MILGCDIGTSFTKGAVLDGGELVDSIRVPTEANPDKAMRAVLDGLREQSKLDSLDFDETVVTGWGESRVSMPHASFSVLNSLARASLWNDPPCRCVLCLGAQNSVVLSLNDKGRVMEYRMNDKCASGCGKFLEIIFEALDISVEESVAIAEAADKKITLSGQCAVFYESDVVSLINAGESVANITEAIFEALTKTVGTLCKKVKTRGPVLVGGGLANNSRIVGGIEAVTGKPVQVFGAGPDLMGAIGAALSVEAAL